MFPCRISLSEAANLVWKIVGPSAP